MPLGSQRNGVSLGSSTSLPIKRLHARWKSAQFREVRRKDVSSENRAVINEDD